jgi:subtilase family serine protease
MYVLRKGAVAVAIGAALVVGGSAANASAQRGMVRLQGNVAGWLQSATPVRGSAAGRVTVSVYLKGREEQSLKALIGAVSNPASPQYQQFVTPKQFHQLFSPSPVAAAAVERFLRTSGLRVGYVPGNRSYVTASGSLDAIERAFGVRERLFRYQGLTLRGTLDNPRLPRALAAVVQYVGGLDETDRLVRSAAQTPTPTDERPSAPPGPGYATPGPCSTYWADHSATVTPPAHQYGSTLPWTPCGYTPPQIRAAYGVDRTNLTGAGVTVGITDAFASPTIVSDVNTFSQHYGLPLLNNSNFQQLGVPGTANFPENRFDPQGWFGEETLDVEWVHVMAPGAKIVFAGGQNSDVPLDHALINMIDNHTADIITNSWGIYGEPNAPGHIKADEQAFEQAAAEGISVLFSSGDDGDVAALTGLAQGSWPATSPYVTAVGGTSLALHDASGAKDEWGWGTYTATLTGSTMSNSGTAVTGTAWEPWPPTFLYGAGGGISVNFLQPGYQAGVVPTAVATSTTRADGSTVRFNSPHRVIPDIAMDADPNTGVLVGETYQISGDALIDAGCTPLGNGYEYCERRLGGTSLASPLFAGVVALVDQARKSAGKGPIGFLNPALYSTGSASAAIRDVLAPSAPTAVLRNTGATGQSTTLRTINSVPEGTTGPVIEGADTSLRTTAGWDDVTGLGTPWAPDFVTALVNWSS